MSESEYLVQVRGLQKRFHVRREEGATLKRAAMRLFRPYPHEPFWALKGVDIAVKAGEMVGLIGVNGSGKSTLLRIIGGVYVPTVGEVAVTGEVGVLFELESGFHGELSGKDNIFLSGALMGYSRAQVTEALPRVVETSELADFLAVPVKAYSSGMKFRLGFGLAMAFDPQVLLVDEVLAAADEAFQRRTYRRLEEFRDGGSAVIMVSHELDAVRRHCDRVIWLHGGEVRADGPTSAVLDEYLGSLEAEQTTRPGAPPATG